MCWFVLKSTSPTACRDERCVECSSDGACVKCQPNYVVRDGKCIAWRSYLCQDDGDDTVGCFECSNGVTNFVNCIAQERTASCFYTRTTYDGSSCLSLYTDDEVTTVRSRGVLENGNCVVCHDGFYRHFDETTGTPHCESCGANCAMCNATRCLACNRGMVFTQDRTVCGDPSAKGMSYRDCGTAKVLKDGVCQDFPGGCLSCTIDTTCTLCEPSSVVLNGTCVPIEAHCLESNGRCLSAVC